MRKFSIQINLQLFVFFLVAAIGFNTYAQEFRQKTPYTSNSYKVAFQIPEDSTKQTESTEQRTVYVGEKNRFGEISKLVFRTAEDEIAEQTSKLLATDEGMETIASAFIRLQGKNTEVLEKRRVQIAGLNAMKIVTSSVLSGKKFRIEMFVIPVPEHKRSYTFYITTLENNFESWFPVAEAAVNSFELLKSERK